MVAQKIKHFSKHFCNNSKSAYFYLQSASKYHKFSGNTDISNSNVFCSVRVLELQFMLRYLVSSWFDFAQCDMEIMSWFELAPRLLFDSSQN